MPWSLDITDPAQRDLTKLPSNDQQALIQAFDRMATNPQSVDLKKLSGREHVWRLRVGRWRAILDFDNSTGHDLRSSRVAPQPRVS